MSQLDKFLIGNGASIYPLSEMEHARKKLMEIKTGSSVAGYIQAFHTLMYKVPQMTQEEGFSFFMRGLDPKIHEQIGYHEEENLGRAMAMVGKADVWWTGGREKKKDKNNKK